MNNKVFEGKWKPARGQGNLSWEKLTEDDLDKADVQFDKLIGLLQEKYGYTPLQAQEEWEKR